MTGDYDALRGLTVKDAKLEAALRGEAFLLFDGGMGTMMQAAGIAGPGVVPDLLNLSAPQQISAIHRLYVEAGAEVITCNTFGANRRKLEGRASVDEVFAAAAACAREAGARYIAGDIGPLGALLQPMGELSFEEAYELFAEQARAAQAAGCDLLAIETLSDLREAKAAVLACRENSTLPVFVTMTFEGDGRTFLGTTPTVAAATLSALGAHAVGTNCSLGPAQMGDIVEELARACRVPLMVQPNAGLPRIEDGQTVFDVSPQDFSAAMEGILDAGASIVGGCCGTTPAFTAQLAALIKTYGTPRQRPACDDLILTSAQEAVVLPAGSPFVAVIGERINPTGKPKLKAALLEGDLDYLVGEAAGQQAYGADVLDVNVGLPGLDEPAVLDAAVQRLQSTCTLPLVIDSSDPAAVERAVRGYAGRPLINSVNGKRDSLEAILPIAKRYGAAVIGLTLDEEGIPPTAQGRFAIAERIVRAAEGCGIPRCDVVIDCLTMAVATNQDEAAEILAAIRMVKERLGVRTTLGVSNISFGLPQRPLMNASFLSAALGAGLDLPILNPNAARYRDAVACHRVITGQDRGARSYIARCQENPDPYEAPAGAALDAGMLQQGISLICQATGVELGGLETPAAPPAGCTPEAGSVLPVPPALADAAELAASVQELILSGRSQPMPAAVGRLLEGHEPLDVIDGLLIPTLDEVGRRFDKGEYFLPQLMASAEAVKAGFDVVKERLGDAAGQQAGGDGCIIIATVKGDIHDIGKNIVKMLLENYGFRVVDLGRDVAPEDVLAAVREHHAPLVGLSALMTTTVKAMEETIALLRAEEPAVKIMVGGAVLTEDYAQTMGADYYAKDAAASARIAEACLGSA
ncbi:MAG: homocysteine S-methyltransferase family protein [Coriobacteriales bacterium]|nr:homocysteine S-methyltransferase family protein [Coriobacteriales bacterium]